MILLGCVASITLAFFLWPREREPEYYGVPLSGWLARCSSSNRTEALGARETIRQNATNALPTLVRWIQHETPGWRRFVARVASKLPSAILDSRCLQWMLDDQAEMRANAAVVGFEFLGARAEPAFSNLQRLAENTNREQTARRAWICMAYIDTTRTLHIEPQGSGWP